MYSAAVRPAASGSKTGREDAARAAAMVQRADPVRVIDKGGFASTLPASPSRTASASLRQSSASSASQGLVIASRFSPQDISVSMPKRPRSVSARAGPEKQVPRPLISSLPRSKAKAPAVCRRCAPGSENPQARKQGCTLIKRSSRSCHAANKSPPSMRKIPVQPSSEASSR